MFDRLLGTFAPYTTEPTFGVTGGVSGATSPDGPIAANVSPFAALAREVSRRQTLGGKLRALFVRD